MVLPKWLMALVACASLVIIFAGGIWIYGNWKAHKEKVKLEEYLRDLPTYQQLCKKSVTSGAWDKDKKVWVVTADVQSAMTDLENKHPGLLVCP